MTRAEAQAEAVRRWGAFAFATPAREWRGYRVGREVAVKGKWHREVLGYSLKSFEVAFSKADERVSK